jgi:hypothetical protein
MKLHASLGLGLVLAAAVTGSAFAEDNDPAAPAGGRRFEVKRIGVDASQAKMIPHEQLAAAEPPSRIIYLNRCAGGCEVRRGFESSINNTSEIIELSIANIPEFPYSDAVWDQVVQCVRDTYAPFNISITDQDPGNVPHWENIVAGSPGDVGMQQGVGGVSPYDFNACSILENTITFTFAEVWGPDVTNLCWTAAQETAHSFGLDHEFLSTDPMTYLEGSGTVKRFQDVDAQCGEYEARDCYCPWNLQNSVEILNQIFGPSVPTPPDVTITEPSFGANVTPSFVIRAQIEDANGIARAQLEIDGNAVGVPVTSAPWVFNASNLTEGTHRISVVATDNQGTEGSASAYVVVGPPCETPGDCTMQGDNLTCVDGRCVPGEGADGGLGDTCEDGGDCLSGQCASNGDGTEKYCIEFCEPGNNGCPGDFGCKDLGNGQGVCWPGAGDGGGCLDAGKGSGVPTLPIGIGLALGALFFRRRRRA